MLWVWNGRITDSLINHQLAEMRSAGLAEVIISPVGTERLDTARVAHAQREAQRIGMRASLASSHPELSGDTRMLRLRQAASAAHVAGRPRIPAKLPVEEERSLTPQEARIRIGAMAARGVNLMVLHANSEREPWWFAMGDLVTWTARVSDLALGKSAAPLALLVPPPRRSASDRAAYSMTSSRNSRMRRPISTCSLRRRSLKPRCASAIWRRVHSAIG